MKFFLSFSLIASFNIFSNDMSRVDIDFEGEPRHYLIYEPNNDIKTNSLVIGIHGYTGTASGFEKETTGGFNLSADKYNFIAVYPQGTYFYEDKPFGRFLNNTYVSSWNDLTGSRTKTKTGETCAADAPVYPKFPNCSGADAGVFGPVGARLSLSYTDCTRQCSGAMLTEAGHVPSVHRRWLG